MYLISILLGLITAIIASNKGYSFFRWWVKGTVFAPFTLLYAIFMKKNPNPSKKRRVSVSRIQCPRCKEMVEANAENCHFCHKKIEIIDV